MQPQWKYNSFNELSAVELYAIMQLRNQVFVVEQNCVYQDADDKDYESFHLCGWDGKNLVAYCRILPKGISYTEASIGRVVTCPSFRNAGWGRVLMNLAIEKTVKQFNCDKIIISAQYYLTTFYKSLGFVQTSEIYLEDNIPHIEMLFTV